MADENKSPVAVITGNTVVDVYQQDKPFLTYNYATNNGGTYKPFLHPVMGPNHWPITQNGEFPGTLRGHYWHHGIFIGHAKVSHKTKNGSSTSSFWEEKDGCGRIVHEEFEPMKSGDLAVIAEKLIWRSPEDKEILYEHRIITVPKAKADERIIDIEIRLKAARDSVRLEQTGYNLLAVRVDNSMVPTQEKAEYTKKYGSLVDFRPMLRGGTIINSEGIEEGKERQSIRGERAKWVDYSGPLDNVNYGGIAIMDHPKNPRFPTYWHNWNNMTICAAFTHSDHFELTLDKDLKLKYRVFIHAGGAKEADVEGVWVDFGLQE